MDFDNLLRWQQGGTHGTGGINERPSKRLRASKSHAALLQPVTRLVRSPLDTIGSIAESLGYGLDGITLHLSKEEEEKHLHLLRLKRAKTYEEWQDAAAKLDAIEGVDTWRAQEESDEYDVGLVKKRLEKLEAARDHGDFDALRFQVRTALTRDLGGMGNIDLYKHSRIGTKSLIERYLATVIEAIEMMAKEKKSGLGDEKYPHRLRETFVSARQAFGRSALLLSGGGTLGMNHIGVIKALWEQGLLPRIVSGASAGSIVCAVLCTKTDAEIPDVLHEFCHGALDVFENEEEPRSILRRATRFFTTGAVYDIANLKRVMDDLLGTMTFAESYRRTRKILNICVSNAGMYEMPQLLNYVTSPNVMISSAVAASCSVPGVFTAASLLSKDPVTNEVIFWDESGSKWIDGSVDNDLPMTRLAEIFNVNHFIVSQVNPHVIPFLAQEEEMLPTDLHTSNAVVPGRGWMQSVANIAKGEALHRMHVLAELGFIPNVMTKLRSVLGQRYAGDVTIMPEISYIQFPNILSNPTTEFMEQAMLNGERATWPKLSRIRNHLAIELKLDEAVHKASVNISFSVSQENLRFTDFARTISTSHMERGRQCRLSRSSKASHKSVRSNIMPRRVPDREAAHRQVHSMFDPSLSSLRIPTVAAPTPPESDTQSETSLSPPRSPLLELPPSSKELFPSKSQPTTPSKVSNSFLSDSDDDKSTRTPRLAGLTMTPRDAGSSTRRPSSPERLYKRMWHRRDSQVPTSRSQTATPESGEEVSTERLGLFKRRSRLGLNIDMSSTRDKIRRNKRSLSTGLPHLRPPDRR